MEERRAGEKRHKAGASSSPCAGGLLAKHLWQTHAAANAKSTELETVAPLHAMSSPAGPYVLVSSPYQCEQLFPTPEMQTVAATRLF